MSDAKIVLETNIPGLPVRRGKVRDVYDLGDRLLFVASDRISAFDVVMPNGIPRKGEVLTRLSAFWFDRLKSIPAHHLIELIESKSRATGSLSASVLLSTPPLRSVATTTPNQSPPVHARARP